jgi:hypothetical protein
MVLLRHFLLATLATTFAIASSPYAPGTKSNSAAKSGAPYVKSREYYSTVTPGHGDHQEDNSKPPNGHVVGGNNHEKHQPRDRPNGDALYVGMTHPDSKPSSAPLDGTTGSHEGGRKPDSDDDTYGLPNAMGNHQHNQHSARDEDATQQHPSDSTGKGGGVIDDKKSKWKEAQGERHHRPHARGENSEHMGDKHGDKSTEKHEHGDSRGRPHARDEDTKHQHEVPSPGHADDNDHDDKTKWKYEHGKKYDHPHVREAMASAAVPDDDPHLMALRQWAKIGGPWNETKFSVPSKFNKRDGDWKGIYECSKRDFGGPCRWTRLWNADSCYNQ